MNLENKTINFLGDSITEGCGVKKKRNRYDKVMERMCSLKKANNYGVGGTRIAPRSVPSSNPRYDEDFAVRAADMDRNADIVVVFGGVNDYLHGDAPFGSIGDKDRVSFCGSVDHLSSTLCTLFPLSTVVFFTPAHTAGDNEFSTCDIKPKRREEHILKEYSDAIKEIALRYGFKVFSMMEELGIDPNKKEDRERYTVDG
ncbi:MAG: SGNH/GDSL hydrolase family protein, partial [Candidatus Ornithospirochaeta sp.]